MSDQSERGGVAAPKSEYAVVRDLTDHWASVFDRLKEMSGGRISPARALELITGLRLRVEEVEVYYAARIEGELERTRQGNRAIEAGLEALLARARGKSGPSG